MTRLRFLFIYSTYLCLSSGKSILRVSSVRHENMLTRRSKAADKTYYKRQTNADCYHFMLSKVSFIIDMMISMEMKTSLPPHQMPLFVTQQRYKCLYSIKIDKIFSHYNNSCTTFINVETVKRLLSERIVIEIRIKT